MRFFCLIIFFYTCLGCSVVTHAEIVDTKPSEVELKGENTISVEGNETSYDVVFKTAQEAGVAIFQRGSKWYFVFDKIMPFEVAGKANTEAFIETIRLIPQDEPKPTTTVVEVVFKPGVSFSIHKKIKEWHLRLFFFDPTEPGSLIKEAVPEKQIRLKETKWPHIQISPLKGDSGFFIKIEGQKYYVIPYAEVEEGIRNVFFDTPYYSLINAIQGFVCEIFSENVFFEKASTNLSIKPINEFVSAEKSSDLRPYSFSYFRGDDVNWVDYRQELDRRMFAKGDDVTMQDNLEKAWVDVALGCGTEALVQLDLMKKKYPGVSFFPIFKVIEGMAYFLKKEFSKALENWELVTETEEMAILKMMTYAEQNIMVPYSTILKKGEGIIAQYPPILRAMILENFLHLLSSLGDFQSIASIVNNTEHVGSNLRLKSLFEYYRALTLIKIGKPEQGVALLTEASQSSARRYFPLDIKQDLDMCLIEQQLLQNILSVDQAIHLFSEARFRLRSCATEYQIVRKLISLYEGQKKYQEMLDLAYYLQTAYPKRALLERMDLKLKKFLMDFFSQDLSKISPLKVVSIYEQYRDLIPDNEAGDQLIHVIADEFVSIDLLENAAHILTKWAMHKKSVLERNKILVRVVEIFITDQKFESALAVLDSMKELTPDIAQKVITLKARCLSKMSRSIEALNLLKDSPAPEHRQLMINIYMDYKRWNDAATEAVLLSAFLDGDQQKDQKKDLLVTASVANYLGEDKEKLLDLPKLAPDFVKEDKQFKYLTRNPLKVEPNRSNVEKHLAETRNLAEIVRESLGAP